MTGRTIDAIDRKTMPWGLTLAVIDPFGYRLTFIEPPTRAWPAARRAPL